MHLSPFVHNAYSVCPSSLLITTTATEFELADPADSVTTVVGGGGTAVDNALGGMVSTDFESWVE